MFGIIEKFIHTQSFQLDCSGKAQTMKNGVTENTQTCTIFPLHWKPLSRFHFISQLLIKMDISSRHPKFNLPLGVFTLVVVYWGCLLTAMKWSIVVLISPSLFISDFLCTRSPRHSLITEQKLFICNLSWLNEVLCCFTRSYVEIYKNQKQWRE